MANWKHVVGAALTTLGMGAGGTAYVNNKNLEVAGLEVRAKTAEAEAKNFEKVNTRLKALEAAKADYNPGDAGRAITIAQVEDTTEIGQNAASIGDVHKEIYGMRQADLKAKHQFALDVAVASYRTDTVALLEARRTENGIDGKDVELNYVSGDKFQELSEARKEALVGRDLGKLNEYANDAREVLAGNDAARDEFNTAYETLEKLAIKAGFDE